MHEFCLCMADARAPMQLCGHRCVMAAAGVAQHVGVGVEHRRETGSGTVGVDGAQLAEVPRNLALVPGGEDGVDVRVVFVERGAAEKQALLEADSLEARAETLIAMAEIEMARSGTGAPLQ